MLEEFLLIIGLLVGCFLVAIPIVRFLMRGDFAHVREDFTDALKEMDLVMEISPNSEVVVARGFYGAQTIICRYDNLDRDGFFVPRWNISRGMWVYVLLSARPKKQVGLEMFPKEILYRYRFALAGYVTWGGKINLGDHGYLLYGKLEKEDALSYYKKTLSSVGERITLFVRRYNYFGFNLLTYHTRLRTILCKEDKDRYCVFGYISFKTPNMEKKVFVRDLSLLAKEIDERLEAE